MNQPHTSKRVGLIVLLCSIALTSAAPAPASAGGILPPLGTASSFGVLAGSTVTNTGPTTVRGDVGVSPGTAVTGFPPGIVNGTIHAGDAVAAQAQNDATIAYNNAAGQACDFDLTGQNLGGMTLTPGVYCFTSSAQLTGQLTLDGLGNPDSVFIFQVGSTLTTASDAQVLVINDADPCRVFWQVGSSATLGTSTSFQGNILALTSITLTTGASTSTGLYALNGAVTLDTNDIQACGFVQGATPTPTLVSTATATATAITTATAIPPTATSTTGATNTPVPLATNTRAPVATDTPVNTPVNTPTSVPNLTATAIASATSIGVPSTTPVATGTIISSTPEGTAIGTATGIASGTAIGTSTSTSLTVTPTTAIALGTITVEATVAGTSTPGSTLVVPGETSVTTQTMTPTPRPLLPPTGAGQSVIGIFTLLLAMMLLLIGMNIRMLVRKAGTSVGRN